MSDDKKIDYGYDPFANPGKNRWGRKVDAKAASPEIPGYEIIDLLGSGGMGAVWSAKYIPLNQPRAIKVLNPALAMDHALLDRFAEEAKALARLDHRYIVKVYDVSADPKCPYMSMDFIGGKTLSDILKVRSLTDTEALKYLGQIAEALDYAHDMGFTHRDIKPSNVIIANSGNAMLIDFGVAIWLGGAGERANAIAGTTRYLSPEACRGERVTKASDIWAFAVLMYRTITGTLPFEGKTGDEVIQAILKSPPKDPPTGKRKVREYLRSLFEKDPKLRPRTATEMVEGLRRVLKPTITRAGREGIAMTTALLLVGVGVVLISGIVAGFMAMRPGLGHGGPKTSKHLKLVPDKEAAPDAGAATTSAGASGPLSTADISGTWYGTLGAQYADVRITAVENGKFHVTCEQRDATGATVAMSDGSLTPNDGIVFQEADAITVGGTPALAKFTGKIEEDGKRIAGKLKHADGSEVDEELVRAINLASTLFTDPTLGFSVPVPSGWQATPGESTTISPIGRPDVAFLVSSTPLDGATTVAEVFSRREQTLTTAGGYQNLGSAPRTIAGRSATGWEFKVAAQNGGTRHALLIGFIEGDHCVTVESWWPDSEEDVWSPVLGGMRDRLAFAGAGPG